MKFFRYGLLTLVGLTLTTAAFAFNTQNQTNLFLALGTSFWEGNYSETVGPGLTSNGWPTDKWKDVSVQWGAQFSNGTIVLIGNPVTCSVRPHGVQVVTGHCTVTTDSDNVVVCQEAQQSPTVVCE